MIVYDLNKQVARGTKTEQAKRPFASLRQFKEAQAYLRYRYHQHGAQASVLDDMTTFIERGRETGQRLANAHDRLYAQTILDYWANKLHRANWPEPDATLVDYRERRKRKSAFVKEVPPFGKGGTSTPLTY